MHELSVLAALKDEGRRAFPLPPPFTGHRCASGYLAEAEGHQPATVRRMVVFARSHSPLGRFDRPSGRRRHSGAGFSIFTRPVLTR